MGKFYILGIAGVLGVLALNGARAGNNALSSDPEAREAFAQCNDQGTLDQTQEAISRRGAALMFHQGQIKIADRRLKHFPDGRTQFQWNKCRITLRADSDLKAPLKLNGLHTNGMTLNKTKSEECDEILGSDLSRLKEIQSSVPAACYAFTAHFPDLAIYQKKKERKVHPDYPDSRIEKMDCALRIDEKQIPSMHFEDFKAMVFSSDAKTLVETRQEAIAPQWQVGMSACDCIIDGSKPCKGPESNVPSNVPSNMPSNSIGDSPSEQPVHEDFNAV